MKCRRQQIALLHGDGSPIVKAGKHVYGGTNAKNDGGPDEDAVVGIGRQGVYSQGLFEAIDLTSKRVAPDSDVHQTQGDRVLLSYLVGQHYHASASTPYGPAFGGHMLNGFP